MYATVLVPAAWLVLEDSVLLPSHGCQTGREVSCHTYGYPVRVAGSCPRVPVRKAGSCPRVPVRKAGSSSRVKTAKSHALCGMMVRYGVCSVATSELVLPRQQFRGELAATVLVSVDCRGHSPIASPPHSLSQLIAVEHGQGATCFVAWPYGLEPVTALRSPQLG